MAIIGSQRALLSAGSGDIVNGLIGWWPMTSAEVSGTTINEKVASLNATMNASGNFSTVAGPGGLLATALATNGSGIATYTGNTLRNWSSGDFTIAAWFKLGDLLAGGGALSQRPWVDNRNGGTTEFMEVNFEPAATTARVRVMTDNARKYRTSATAQYAAGEWHHFAQVNRGGGSGGVISLHFDGVEVVETTQDTGGGGWGTTEGIFFAGESATSGGSMNNLGALCGIRAYSRALVSADTAKLFRDKT